jgi:acetyl-CoA carboxylase biotin carboxyl carrier protein
MTAMAARTGSISRADQADESQPAALLAAFDHVMRTAPTQPCRVLVQWGEVTLEVSWPAGPITTTTATGTAAAAPSALAGDPPSEPGQVAEERATITAPLVGAFFRCPEPGAPAFVEVGDIVELGQEVAIIEAMKLMNVITAESQGRIVDVLVADGAPVEYGQALFVLEPAEEG